MCGQRERAAASLWVVVVGCLLLTAALVVMLARAVSDDAAKEPTSPDGSASATPTDRVIEAPTPGSLDPVPVAEPSRAPAVSLDAIGDFGTGLTLRIVDIAAVEGVARGPGEISGPALRLTMEARNSSRRPVSLEGMVVALDHGATKTPAATLSEPGGDPFVGQVAPGGTARASYVFAIPEGARDRVRVTTSYTGSAPTVIFRGDAG